MNWSYMAAITATVISGYHYQRALRSLSLRRLKSVLYLGLDWSSSSGAC